MMRKLFMHTIILCVVSIIPLKAAEISILVIETGLTVTSPNSTKSIMWENGLMEVLFDTGHIASNAPILRLPAQPGEGLPSAAVGDLIDAKENGMRYFIIAIVNNPSPHNVILRLFNTETSEMLFEHIYIDTAYETERLEYESILENIRVLTARIR